MAGLENNIQCAPISEICELDTSFYDLDPMKTVYTNTKIPTMHILGGIVYGVSCKLGHVLEYNAKKNKKSLKNELKK